MALILVLATMIIRVDEHWVIYREMPVIAWTLESEGNMHKEFSKQYFIIARDVRSEQCWAPLLLSCSNSLGRVLTWPIDESGFPAGFGWIIEMHQLGRGVLGGSHSPPSMFRYPYLRLFFPASKLYKGLTSIFEFS